MTTLRPPGCRPPGCLLLALALCHALAGAPAAAATLQVGPGQAFQTPSQAAAAAQDGDTVRIAPGEYFDCAIWNANALTIEAAGPGVVLTDTACAGKAAFVTRGTGTTLRGLTFARIRVPDRNGAGVRADGGSLTIERSAFVNDQVGLLIADDVSGPVVVRECVFDGNGVPGLDAAADIRIGPASLLRVEQSRLSGGRAGPAITSAARNTELVDNQITPAAGERSYVVGLPEGGRLMMAGNAITLASLPRLGAVLVTHDQAPAEVTLRGNSLVNQQGAAAVLLRDWGGMAPVLAGNIVQPGDTEWSTEGATLHAAKQAAHGALAGLRAMGGTLRGWAATLLRPVLGRP